MCELSSFKIAVSFSNDFELFGDNSAALRLGMFSGSQEIFGGSGIADSLKSCFVIWHFNLIETGE